MREANRIKRICATAFVLGAVCAIILNALFVLLLQRYAPTLVRAKHPPAASRSESPDRSARGGIIEAVEIPLANPEGDFPDQNVRLAEPKWLFENFTENRLARFLSSCDLRPVESRTLLDTRSWNVTSTGIVVSPLEQLVWSLSHSSRQQIYSALAKSKANFPECFPFRFPLQGFDLKFKASGLPVEQLERLKRLTYTNGDYLCFTDLEAIKARLKPDEFKELVETLYQLPTYLLRLHVTPDSDIDALVKYWGKGGREKLIAPLLNSLGKVPGGTQINVSYLLPTFTRLRLYTYPYAWNDPTAGKQDCFFTSLNFFNQTADTNFFDGAYTAAKLQADYVPI